MTIMCKTSILALLAAMAGCASTAPSSRLVDARRAYVNLEQSNATQVAPAEVLSARQALNRAEAVHAREPGSEIERHFAYLAERQSQLAETRANITASSVTQRRAEQRYIQTEEELRARAEASLEDVQDSLDESRRKRSNLQDALGSEREARKDAEERAKQALSSLSSLAKVKQEARETTITLSGQVLFASGRATLLPTARRQLSAVAEALKAQGSDAQFAIEGHTDSVGNEADNLGLSERRAAAVKVFLQSEGVPAARLKAVGKGESEPIAENDTATGRANNRRVEIVIRH